eukprot:7919906-Pyramimonas_sp.AAC.1
MHRLGLDLPQRAYLGLLLRCSPQSTAWSMVVGFRWTRSDLPTELRIEVASCDAAVWRRCQADPMCHVRQAGRSVGGSLIRSCVDHPSCRQKQPADDDLRAGGIRGRAVQEPGQFCRVSGPSRCEREGDRAAHCALCGACPRSLERRRPDAPFARGQRSRQGQGQGQE